MAKIRKTLIGMIRMSVFLSEIFHHDSKSICLWPTRWAGEFKMAKIRKTLIGMIRMSVFLSEIFSS